MNIGTTSPFNQPLSTVVTRKGQITIPAPIRDALGIKQGDTIALQVEGGDVKLTPVASTLAEGYQSIPALKKPLSWKEMKENIHEERAEAYAQKARS